MRVRVRIMNSWGGPGRAVRSGLGLGLELEGEGEGTGAGAGAGEGEGEREGSRVRRVGACMASLLPAWLQANPNPNPNPNPNLHGELVAGVAAAVDDVEGGHGQVHLVRRVAREHGDVLVQRQALGRGAW